MSGRRIAVIALTGALVVGGAGAAIGAVTQDDDKKVEQAILDDAAKRLNVTPEQLRDALGAAADAQIDQAVKDGLLTQEQADAIKEHRDQSGRVLGPLLQRGLHGKPGMAFGRGIAHDLFADIAKALGISTDKLASELRDGKTLAQIAKAEGKSLADVKSAVRAAVKTQLDKAVDDGNLTRKQADAMLEHLDEHIDALATGARLPGFRGHMFRGGPGPGLGLAGPHDLFADIAKALGVSTDKLASDLRDGKSLSAIAKAQGKSLSDVKSAVKASVKTRLDKAVDDGDITRKQADAMLEHLDAKLDAIAAGRKLRFHRRGGPPLEPPPGIRPGGFAPDEMPAPPVIITEGTFS